MAFTIFPIMLQLQVKNGSDLKSLLSYGTDKACSRFAPYIADAVVEPMRDGVRQGHVYSVMFDGATDCSISENEIIYCRYLKNGVPCDVIVGLEELQHAHADGVYDAILRSMTKFVGPDWLDKLVAIGCDGASVNLGARNSVATRFRGQHDYILPIHCVCHRLELGVVNAIKNDNRMTIIQDILKKIHKHYHYSPKALRDLKNIADVMEERIIKPTRLQGTRWTPHVCKAAKVLGNQFYGYHGSF